MVCAATGAALNIAKGNKPINKRARFAARFKNINRMYVSSSIELPPSCRRRHLETLFSSGFFVKATFQNLLLRCIASLEESLKRLQIASVDVVLIHDVSPTWHADALEQSATQEALQFSMAHPAIASVAAFDRGQGNLQHCATAFPRRLLGELKDARLILPAAAVPSWRAVT